MARARTRMARAGIATLALAPSVACGQWEYTSLQVPGEPFASVHGIDGGVPVGSNGEAGFWSEYAPDSFVSLQPPSLQHGSQCLGAHEGQQVGSVNYLRSFYGIYENRASLWSGSADTWVSLHTQDRHGISHSTAVATHGGQQVGWTWTEPVTERAALWTGTAASVVDLMPAGARVSLALGVHDGVQVGSALFDETRRAGLWRGTADSWVDLHPAGASRSSANAADAGVQGGEVWIDGVPHAALWRGTAESWENLGTGVIYAMHDGWQVGVDATLPVVWNGTAASRELLPIPDGFDRVATTDIWHDGQTLYVVGQARGTFTQAAHVWTRPMAACRADLDGDGDLTIFDFLAFQNLFDLMDPLADFDGDGSLTIFDFLAFQNAFDAGCP
ncbi:MAG: GC-type dockerin domain-anchored protein [Phycisphaerales bacterium]